MKMNDVFFDPFDVGVRKNPPYPTAPVPFPVMEHIGRILFLDPRRVKPMDGQPRTNIGDVADLAEEIKVDGQKDAILVFPIVHPDFDAEVEAGHRRRGATDLAGLMVRSEIRPIPKDKAEQYDDAFIDNFNREDLTLLDTVLSIEKLLANGRTWQDIARMAGKTRAWVDQYTILVRMNPEVRPLMEEQNNGLENEVGRKLRRKTALPLSIWLQIAKMPMEKQLPFARRMVDGGVSIETVRFIVQKELTEQGVVLRQRSPIERFMIFNQEVNRTERFFRQYLEMSEKNFMAMFESRDQASRIRLAEGMRGIAFHLKCMAAAISVSGSGKSDAPLANMVESFRGAQGSQCQPNVFLSELHPRLQQWVSEQMLSWKESGRSLQEWQDDQAVASWKESGKL